MGLRIVRRVRNVHSLLFALCNCASFVFQENKMWRPAHKSLINLGCNVSTVQPSTICCLDRAGYCRCTKRGVGKGFHYFTFLLIALLAACTCTCETLLSWGWPGFQSLTVVALNVCVWRRFRHLGSSCCREQLGICASHCSVYNCTCKTL